ncbi:MAG: HAMP domain-containing histidine kinase [Butyrivibrio sp.]|nr:HAMP domain-containing histidine kinase [Butyrivibrio sp.]
MKRRLILAAALFAFVFCAAAALLYFWERSSDNGAARQEQLVALNEIEQLAGAGELELLYERTGAMRESIRAMSDRGSLLPCFCAAGVIFAAAVFCYVYFCILRPFEKMKKFAGLIARGNFDVPLDYDRSDYFGEFTWAFDSMRREITKARACEKEAADNNKTIIATLSHDIKTPIASIRAYAEGLEANLDATPEKRAKYLGVLMKKCDEVSRLTDDLFLHSLADLERLKINPEEFELCGFVWDIAAELAGERGDIDFVKPSFKAWVRADKNRLVQLAENLVNNSRKYAKTAVKIYITQSDGDVLIHFRDFGQGIPDGDMPFIFDKFYRGKNSAGESGSGLGLYIVKYIANRMNGKVLLHNLTDGLEAVISFPSVLHDS